MAEADGADGAAAWSSLAPTAAFDVGCEVPANHAVVDEQWICETLPDDGEPPRGDPAPARGRRGPGARARAREVADAGAPVVAAAPLP